MAFLQNFREILPFLSVSEIEDVIFISTTKKESIPRIQKFELNSLVDEFCYLNFRFYKADILRLRNGLGLQGTYICTNRVKVNSIEALCITLRRLAYPNR